VNGEYQDRVVEMQNHSCLVVAECC